VLTTKKKREEENVNKDTKAAKKSAKDVIIGRNYKYRKRAKQKFKSDVKVYQTVY
jgi:hypothetical protein